MTTVLNSPEGKVQESKPLSLPGESSELSTEKCYNIVKIAPTSFFADYGCHVRIYEESLILQRMGNRVIICTYHTGVDIAGMDIRRVMNTPWNKKVQVGSSLHKLYYDLLLSAKCAGVAFRSRPDIVHAHLHEGALIGYFISRLHGIPLVFDFQGSLTSEMLDHNFLKRDSLAFRPLRRLESVIDRMANVVITSSYNAADILVRDLGYPRGKVRTIPDSVNADSFRPRWELDDTNSIDTLKLQLGLPLDRKVVVYLGLLAEYQGTRKLLQAASSLVKKGLPVHFLIMGYPADDYYRAMAAEMGLAGNTTFTGRIAYQDAPRYLVLGDVAVSPKISETEGNGKLLNYMAAGLPSVAFGTPVAREILGELGVYASPGNAQSLAAALESLLTDEVQSHRLGRELRSRVVKEYSLEKAGRELLAVYNSVSR